ncbi:MAG: PorT family protein [Sphingobacteriales bacterium]|nr:MAG: PorT family protein [Sphingobacteriales bacterium]
MQHLLRRKKITKLLAALLLSPALSFAQERYINQEEHDYKPFHFGINVGVNRSNYSFTHHPQFLQMDSVMVVESINSTGINLSWLVNKKLSYHFDLRTYPLSLIFTEKAFQYHLKYPDKPAGEDSVSIRKIQGITLAFPVQLKFNSDRINNFRVYMMAGVRAEYDFAANKGSKATGAKQLMKLNKFDYGVEAGIGFHFYFPVFVLTPELKISRGLSNVHNRDAGLKYSNVIDKINSRTITFSLTVE